MESQQAGGSAPGWEDWDQDGQPGYTMNITGLLGFLPDGYFTARSQAEFHKMFSARC